MNEFGFVVIKSSKEADDLWKIEAGTQLMMTTSYAVLAAIVRKPPSGQILALIMTICVWVVLRRIWKEIRRV